ncbi:hypothetical protein DFH08DRAFT_1085427 [Mycena albidolilacea]|uniref:Glycosyl hydrolase family 38 C-terminal domain-containing protein n=1 Tax=Mycena albidolilacea TaxID=1033008 RepID=A0AAD6ZI31_9AGAR|nr:hypothetical protein DFH08DRAFT_1085427 [Mycena albidolilacea]
MAQLRPIRAVTDEHRELPPVHMGHSDKFFDYLVERSQGGKVLPTWKGEQYLNHPRCSSRLCDVSVLLHVDKLYAEVGRRTRRCFALNVGLDGNTLHLATQLEFAKVSVVAQGPLRASVRVEVVCWQSRISVTISLDAVAVSTKLNPRSIFCFDAWMDWRQRTSSSPLLALSSDNSIYKTQFDWVQRPTHKNTMWG